MTPEALVFIGLKVIVVIGPVVFTVLWSISAVIGTVMSPEPIESTLAMLAAKALRLRHSQCVSVEIEVADFPSEVKDFHQLRIGHSETQNQ